LFGDWELVIGLLEFKLLIAYSLNKLERS